MNLTYHPKKKFCSRGHEIAIVGRTKYGQCIECKKINDAKANANNKYKRSQWAIAHPHYFEEYYEKHREELRQQMEEYYKTHRDDIAIKAKEWRESHPDIIAQLNREYYETHKDEILARNRQWQKDHPEVMRALKIKCQTNRQLRVVAWTDWGKIIEVYKNCPKGCEVDHYIPLQGDMVAGLHVSWNLRPLPAGDNRHKYKNVNLLEVSEWYGKILEEAGLKDKQI